ncbi:TPA: FRG domain-containing protein [Pseudomonas aeruginosa]|uniref:FRG domain-containing protein n=1 Tax=Pseudomonas aeruginosa TaxID=287 RepID=UPI00135F7E5C|nr:FRG domain-containing protein [Pseudomonas aeruginosa]MBG7505891.1 FRG domain-containing protein [Pseudomonas aeruginosa]MWW04609.1 FRG domain-containing protein [Pseudomonas aeruginosa]HCF2637066.1 FRG domain-containing protein [Pseudomonas aeruginosa]HEJ1656669.1 FRG domain-containing protein [Pseudomonas aeruginosa]HEJ3084946.1 FRG domain-containing protein [Pseudomonas aeruginosa]
MEQHQASTVEELEMLFARFGDDVIFRGQNSHYGEPGQPSIGSSFDRKGCIPSLMLKWSRYCQNVLDTFIQGHLGDLAYQQALLQHYGWRSFYVDCTSSRAVAAWFASHSYSDEGVIEMIEDCEERPVWLRKRMANYALNEGEGHFYVLDKLAASRVGLVNLAALSIAGFRPRTVAQSAWLIGPLRNRTIPQDCYVSHITAPRSVLRDYASKYGLLDTNALFPSATEDPILKALLGLPWEEIKIDEDIKGPPAFRRALDLPEYHSSRVKIAPPSTAFYRGARIIDFLGSIDGDPEGAKLVEIPEIALFGSADRNTPLRFPNIDKLIDEYGSVAFEADTLIKHAQLGEKTLYQKGVGVVRHEPNFFEVCELAVSHPGLALIGAGFIRGWFYRRQADGLWTREVHPLECTCGKDYVHGQHISALHIAEEYLKDPDSFY